ncbi:MAG: sigma-70 family RNA polymerase sigma factor [Kofleriaceae bacterium]|nr:sigma-70 family RNA polymerase sigma factor [Kofleriaceae bacterium]
MRNSLDTLSPNLGEPERSFIFAIAMKFVKNEVEADDVAQDAMLLAHRHRDSFRGQSKYSTWLYRVATTTSLMHLRSKKRKSKELLVSELASEDSSWINSLESTAPSPEETTCDREELGSILQSIDKLGPKYSKLLELRWFRGCSERELSKRLHLPLTTIKTRSYRGRQHILATHALAA